LALQETKIFFENIKDIESFKNFIKFVFNTGQSIYQLKINLCNYYKLDETMENVSSIDSYNPSESMKTIIKNVFEEQIIDNVLIDIKIEKLKNQNKFIENYAENFMLKSRLTIYLTNKIIEIDELVEFMDKLQNNNVEKIIKISNIIYNLLIDVFMNYKYIN